MRNYADTLKGHRGSIDKRCIQLHPLNCRMDKHINASLYIERRGYFAYRFVPFAELIFIDLFALFSTENEQICFDVT